MDERCGITWKLYQINLSKFHESMSPFKRKKTGQPCVPFEKGKKRGPSISSPTIPSEANGGLHVFNYEKRNYIIK